MAFRDRDAGDLGSARLRLISYLKTEKHPEPMCELLATICLDMKDPVEAGKWFFVSNSTHEQAERCISLFVARYKRDPHKILRALQKQIAADVRANKSPAFLTDRFKDLGLIPDAESRKPPEPSRWQKVRESLPSIGCFVILAAFVLSALFGLITFLGIIFKAIKWP